VRGLLFVGLAACQASVGTGEVDVDASANVDAASDDAPSIDAEVPLGPWGAPVPLEITPAGDDDPTATEDLLELYFNRSQDIFLVKRASLADAFGTPVVVSELSSSSNDTTPEVSYDGLTMYLGSSRTGALGSNDIWVATRPSRVAAWSTPVHVAELSSTSNESSSAATIDQLVIVHESTRAGTNDVFVAQRASATGAFGTPVAIDGMNSTASDGNPMLSADQLTLYFDSNRTGDNELYFATRPSVDAPFSPPQRIEELASPGNETDAWISRDDRTLYFTSNRDGTTRLWQSTR
jgi:Tol biopolymer transport system component